MRKVFEIQENRKLSTNVNSDILQKLHKIRYNEWSDDNYEELATDQIDIDFDDEQIRITFEYDYVTKAFYAVYAEDCLRNNITERFLGQMLEVNEIREYNDPLPF